MILSPNLWAATTQQSVLEPAKAPILEPLLDGYYPPYPKVSPKAPFTAEQVARGEYLAKAGDCIACHTNTKMNIGQFAGNLPIVSPFGTFYSSNITPDKETGIGSWTEEDFRNAMQHGRHPSGYNYFPAFPYVYFSNLAKEDIKDLYAYFMSIPAIHHKNHEHGFPLNLPGARFSLWGWKLLFFFPNEKFKYDPKQTQEWNRGKYLVDGLGHCSMCHTPLNALGAPKQRFYLTGGFVDGYWAPNITRYGLMGHSRYAIADVFVSGRLLNNAGPVAGPMAEVNHNSLRYLTLEDRVAMSVYLKTVISEDPFKLPDLSKQAPLKKGKQVYVNVCSICHQKGEMSAPVIGDASNWYRRLQTNGLTALYRHVINGYNSMPIKGACLTCHDDDIVAAVDYILHQSLTRSQRTELREGGAASFPSKGEDIYKETCSVCHDKGKFAAPKIGDKQAWAPLITPGLDVLVKNTMSTVHHPKNAGCNMCTHSEIVDAVKYMVEQSKTEGDYSKW
jgi:cytochrome c5